MTRKDFELIAKVLRDAGDVHRQPRLWRSELVRAMADALASTNPRFDRERFIKAATA